MRENPLISPNAISDDKIVLEAKPALHEGRNNINLKNSKHNKKKRNSWTARGNIGTRKWIIWNLNSSGYATKKEV